MNGCLSHPWDLFSAGRPMLGGVTDAFGNVLIPSRRTEVQSNMLRTRNTNLISKKDYFAYRGADAKVGGGQIEVDRQSA
jgi:hypothetical protein